ncbi:YkvA family protein [Neobacillus mesonae]|uniref:YkvA family protein n=1 Tax=Neobacillus mesonae TaxID=1193713 RepID=UPI002040952E|nr:YkvA family protein [Neobacillus mesonae]MCM3567196.1 YkvA family protein [Neobacillus mesonae]
MENKDLFKKEVSNMVKKLKWKEFIRNIKNNIYILYLACRHPNTPWYAKALSLLIVAYALSPIDLIPDVIPVLGYLDEAILLPLGILGAFSLIPKEVLNECRVQASQTPKKLQKKWAGAIIIMLIWISLATSILFRWVI